MVEITHANPKERYCKTPEALRIKLSNVPLNYAVDALFIVKVCEKLNVKPYKLILQTSKKRSLGNCDMILKQVTLFHHNIKTFLHEYAHAIHFEIFGITDNHNANFAKILDTLIAFWLEENQNVKEEI